MNPDVTLSTARTRDLSPAERAAIVRLCTEAHGEDFSPLFTHLPPEGLHVLATLEGAWVSHAVVTTRRLQVGDGPLLRTAYVDAVATHPRHQGQGIGSAVMRRLASAIEDYEIACLETDRVGFYTRLGWEAWRGPLGGRKGAEIIPTPDQEGILILRLPLTPPLDMESGLTIEYQGRIW